MRLSKTESNTSAQHALGHWSTTRPRNYKMCTGWWHNSLSVHVIGRFFPWKHRCKSTPCRGKIVKRWPVRGWKSVGDHCFSVYLSNAYYRNGRLFGTPTAFSVMCSL